ncbi:MAG: hypothetical protein ACXWL2_03805 [Candidatus Chromulinivorax sp.]
MIKKKFSLLILSLNFFLTLDSSSKKTPRSIFDTENQINSQTNHSPIKRLRSLSQTTDVLTPQTAEKINKNLQALQSTPGDSRKIAAQELADWAFSKIVPEAIATPEKNQALLEAYQNKTSSAEVLKSASKIAENREDFVATDIEHILKPDFQYDDENKIIAVRGGHVLQNYPSDVINPVSLLDQSKGNIGVFIGPKNIGKTVKWNMTSQEIIENQKKSKCIGRDGDLDILENKEKELFGVYSSKNNSMIDASQFPLMSANISKKSSDGKVTIFTVAQYNKENKKIIPKKTISASSLEILQLIKEGQKINENVYSVGKAIEEHFKPDLMSNGFPDGKLPGRFYLSTYPKIK